MISAMDNPLLMAITPPKNTTNTVPSPAKKSTTPENTLLMDTAFAMAHAWA